MSSLGRLNRNLKYLDIQLSRSPSEDAWNDHDMRCKFPLGYLQSLHDNIVTDETFKTYQYLHSPDLFL